MTHTHRQTDRQTGSQKDKHVAIRTSPASSPCVCRYVQFAPLLRALHVCRTALHCTLMIRLSLTVLSVLSCPVLCCPVQPHVASRAARGAARGMHRRHPPQVKDQAGAYIRTYKVRDGGSENWMDPSR